MTQCTVESFKENWVLILYGLVIVVVAILFSYPLSRLFVPKTLGSPEKLYQRNIYKYAMVFGNYGFMGNFIILGIWGNEFFYKYSLFVFFVGILCNSWGLYILVPKEQGVSIWKNLKKRTFNSAAYWFGCRYGDWLNRIESICTGFCYQSV